MTPPQRPSLGDIKPGDPVIVTRRGYRTRTNVEAHVTKTARVWITLQETNQVASLAKTWRMRRDTQNEGSGSATQDSFATPEQHAWDQCIDDADRYLREQGIEVRHSSDWYPAHRRMQLADLIRAAEPDPDPHAGCYQPHRGADGYVDCDGRPL